MAYSSPSDLLTGDLKLPDYLSAQKFVDDAADEIDSRIGFLYATPVNVAALKADPKLRPIALLLKRINTFIASGRLIMATDVSGEAGRVHNYGLTLVRDANLALDSIVSGKTVLNIPPADPESDPLLSSPAQYNKDPESNVDAFYDRLANPLPFATAETIPESFIERIFGER